MTRQLKCPECGCELKEANYGLFCINLGCHYVEYYEKSQNESEKT